MNFLTPASVRSSSGPSPPVVSGASVSAEELVLIKLSAIDVASILQGARRKIRFEKACRPRPRSCSALTQGSRSRQAAILRSPPRENAPRETRRRHKAISAVWRVSRRGQRPLGTWGGGEGDILFR